MQLFRSISLFLILVQVGQAYPMARLTRSIWKKPVLPHRSLHIQAYPKTFKALHLLRYPVGSLLALGGGWAGTMLYKDYALENEIEKNKQNYIENSAQQCVKACLEPFSIKNQLTAEEPVFNAQVIPHMDTVVARKCNLEKAATNPFQLQQCKTLRTRTLELLIAQREQEFEKIRRKPFFQAQSLVGSFLADNNAHITASSDHIKTRLETLAKKQCPQGCDEAQAIALKTINEYQASLTQPVENPKNAWIDRILS